MNIEKLELKGFGKFNNLEISFDRGFNIIYGTNESGKSTIEAFIKAMLYSLKGGRSFKEGTLTPQKRYKPWVGTSYGGRMKYTLDNGETFTVERNFDNGETRIYDFLYKDITKNFDQSKDKGPLFAVSHIGLTEACFEKTLFIGQMGSKLGTNDSKEILDRLSNISETGFEDISFKGAHDAIKEALKNYVGTDKTSTRPLDVINSKLDELNDRKQNLIMARESMFSKEEDLTTLKKTKNSLEEEKAVMMLAKEIIRLREDLDSNKKKKKDLHELAREAVELMNECESLTDSINEHKKTKEQLGDFEGFGFEEADDLYFQFTGYEKLNSENSRLLLEIGEQKSKSNEIKNFLESFKGFNTVGDIEIADSAPSTEFNMENFHNAEIHKKIMSLSLKSRVVVAGMAIIFVFFTGFLFYGLSMGRYMQSIAGSSVLLIFFFMLVVLKNKNANLVKELVKSKDVSDKMLKELLEKMENQNKRQADMFKLLEVSSIDEFLKKKALYDSKVYELNGQDERLDKLNTDLERNNKVISELSKSMKEKLFAVKIINSMEDEVKKEHIEELRKSVNRYKEIIPYLNYGENRLKDMEKQINNLYNRAYSICGKKVDCKEALLKLLNEMDNRIKNLYKDLDIYAYKLKSVYLDNSFVGLNFDQMMEVILDQKTEDARLKIEELTQKLLERLNEIQLSIKENEMGMALLNDDSNELERLEEDIKELLQKKAKLEDIGFSLRTALSVLEEANTEIKRDFAPVLNSHASQIVGSITALKYRELKVDENLVPRTTDPFTNNIVPVSMLSGGTVDQMYLALRIALVKAMERKTDKLPIILDEALAQYDDTRSSETLKMLEGLSNERQIILFTCKLREVELAKFVCNSYINVIELL